MEKQKTKIEVWEVVLKNYNRLNKERIISAGGMFCVLRKNNFITWGEWYYLHSILDKCKKKKIYFTKDLIKETIKKLKENESKV